MHNPEFLEALQNNGGVLSASSDDPPTVAHFGKVAAELAAAQSSAVVCPLPNLIRIRATGADRAKFLHSFCTNNVSAMQPGQICEAFFTDVKAKVLAHGLICAFADVHEIWMLPGDEQAILNHLNRYVITEDVTFEAVTDQAAFAVIGLTSHAVLQAAGIPMSADGNGCVATSNSMCVSTTWADLPIVFLSTSSSESSALWQTVIQAGATPSGNVVFDHIRILEGYPTVGIDITSDNMAPEADRNAQTISYTKGCYLGQEPIARLDAMGHVNRKLYRATARLANADQALVDAPAVTSASQAVTDQFPILIPLLVKAVTPSEILSARMPNGSNVEVTIK